MLAMLANNRLPVIEPTYYEAFGNLIPDVIQFKSLDEWLQSIKMSRYRENFERAGIANLNAVARLTPQDLTLIGVTTMQHQKRIMQSIMALRSTTSIGSPGEGYLVWYNNLLLWLLTTTTTTTTIKNHYHYHYHYYLQCSYAKTNRSTLPIESSSSY